MLKIQRTVNGEVVFELTGRLDAEGLAELSRLLALEFPQRRIALELRELVLVNRDAIGFLRGCTERGIELRNCPQFVRTWMASGADEP